MRGRQFCFVLTICGGLAGEDAATEPLGIVYDVRRELAVLGHTRAVAKMKANGDWKRVIALISTGDIGAISLARELAKGSDASASEELTISLAEALPKAPRNVLGVLTRDQNSILSYSRVCSAPFIEDSLRHQREYKAAALIAVRRVRQNRDPYLVHASEYCIAELTKVRS